MCGPDDAPLEHRFRGALSYAYSNTRMSFGEHFTVYATGRLFGGPVFWALNNESKIGTDLYHYQVGGGVIVRLVAGLALYGEGIALGERGAVAGISLTP